MKQLATFIFALFILGANAQPPSANGITLISPYDGQIVNTLTPAFFWSSNITGDFRLEYSIKIAELKAGQTYLDAMQANPPLVWEERLTQTTYMYPVTAFPLSVDKKYVWQIQASINGMPVVLSEIWMFQYATTRATDTSKEVKKVFPKQYVYLSKNVNAAPHLFKDYINFVYNNETRDTQLVYTIKQIGSDALLPVERPTVNISIGLNYISLPITREVQRRAKKKQEVYILQAINSRKETWALKFLIVSKNKERK